MTDEQLQQGKEIKEQIQDLEKVIEFTTREKKYPIFINRDGYNLTIRMSPETDETIRLLIVTDMKKNLEKLREQYNNL